MENKFTAVILAAGMGTRLGDLTKDQPKALTMVCGRPIIEYSIAFARALNPEKIVVVGGFQFDKLKEAVASIDRDVVLVENAEYATTEPLASLAKARDEIVGGCITYNGDYIYDKSIAGTVKEHLDDRIKVFGTSHESDEMQLDMMVRVDERNTVINMSKGLDTHDYYFNSMWYCPEGQVAAFFEKVDDVLKKDNNQKASVERGILEYVSGGNNPATMVDLGPVRWIEIDTKEELSRAAGFIERNFKDNNYFVPKGSSINPRESNINKHILRKCRRLFWNDPKKILLYPIIKKVFPYTLAGYRVLGQVCDAVDHIEKKGIPGSIVEMGCWNGGMGALMAWRVKQHGKTRRVWQFDSFEGLPEFSTADKDKAIQKGVPFSDEHLGKRSTTGVFKGEYKKAQEITHSLGVDDIVSIEKGWFQDTVPEAKRKIGDIALLFVDADIYESTKYCLDELYDLVVPGGMVILDDYETWTGARKAVYEFFTEREVYPSIRYYPHGGRPFFIK
ncbi:MAG: NTP transferase domain-containing protein [Parcubacteria group bacterium]|nr:NTP transferase domain-containing protein [Parcubacteria group bacterium]